MVLYYRSVFYTLIFPAYRGERAFKSDLQFALVITLLSLSFTVCFGIFDCNAPPFVLFQTLELLFLQCFGEPVVAFVVFFGSSEPTHIENMLLFHMSSVVAVLVGILMFAPPTASTIVLTALKLSAGNIILVDHD